MNLASDIAVCVVFFNKAEQTIECIESFAGAKTPIYLLNNGSAEVAAARVRKFCEALPQVRLIEAPTNGGPAAGRNVLVRESREPWLFFVDNDIRVGTPGWLGLVRAHMAKADGADVLAPQIRNVWDDTLVRPVRIGVANGRAVFADAESDEGNIFPGGGAIVRRALFERVGLYDEELFAFEDFELALRAFLGGREIRVRHIKDVQLLHDHRRVREPEDKETVLFRYNADRVGRAHEKVVQVHGVAFDPEYRAWLQEQIRTMTEPAWKRSLRRSWAAMARGPKQQARRLLSRMKQLTR